MTGKPLVMTVASPAKLLSHTSSTATWQATLTGGGLTVNVSGLMDFDSYLEYSVLVTATETVSLSDIVLRVAATNSSAKMMCGMGCDGSYIHDLAWTWNQQQGNNRLWMGRVEAGASSRICDRTFFTCFESMIAHLAWRGRCVRLSTR